MKDIRIFVASSKELEKERNYLAFLVLAKADESTIMVHSLNGDVIEDQR